MDLHKIENDLNIPDMCEWAKTYMLLVSRFEIFTFKGELADFKQFYQIALCEECLLAQLMHLIDFAFCK